MARRKFDVGDRVRIKNTSVIGTIESIESQYSYGYWRDTSRCLYVTKVYSHDRTQTYYYKSYQLESVGSIEEMAVQFIKEVRSLALA